MGRHSKLSPQQVADAERRHFTDGEPIRSIAREFGVDEAGLRRKLNPQKSALRTLAEEKALAEKMGKAVDAKIETLPPSRQRLVLDMARALNNVGESIITAAELNAETAALLASMANAEVKKFNPLGDAQVNTDAVKTAMLLTAGSNEAAKIPLNLIATTKGKGLGDEGVAPTGLGHFYGEE